MGSLNPFKSPKIEDPGKSAFEIDQERRMAEMSAKQEEEKKQAQAGRRGRRALMSESNTGSGYNRSMIS
tara:strand:- start:103 stop:309 length:207 start_codon:yes stop_codon:yes gene_type:complete